jgi:hypothetical protein
MYFNVLRQANVIGLNFLDFECIKVKAMRRGEWIKIVEVKETDRRIKNVIWRTTR